MRRCVYNLSSDIINPIWSDNYYFHLWFMVKNSKGSDIPHALIEKINPGEFQGQLFEINKTYLKFIDPPGGVGEGSTCQYPEEQK